MAFPGMDWLIFGLVVAALIPIGVLAQRKGWIDVVGPMERRGGNGVAGIAGIGDEVFSPTRYEAQLELDRQTILPAPAPIAGDGLDRDVYSGHLLIELGAPREPRHLARPAA